LSNKKLMPIQKSPQKFFFGRFSFKLIRDCSWMSLFKFNWNCRFRIILPNQSFNPFFQTQDILSLISSAIIESIQWNKKLSRLIQQCVMCQRLINPFSI
jgi:hypothetical protein